MWIMAGCAFSISYRHVGMFAFLRKSLNVFVAPITIIRSFFNQLKIVVAGVFVVACETSALCKRFMNTSITYLVEHPLMAIKAEFVFFLDQKLFLCCRVGAVADYTSSDPYWSMNIDPIKEHLLFLMARIALLDLSKPELKLVIRCMGVVAGNTVSFFNRTVNIRLRKIIFFVTLVAKVFACLF